MRSANDAMLDTVLKRKSRKIQTALKLMRLHTGKSKQSWIVVLPKQTQIGKIGLHVLVNDVGFDRVPFHRWRRHAAQIRNRRIRHEAATESLDAARLVVFARLQDQNAKLLHSSPSD